VVWMQQGNSAKVGRAIKSKHALVA
jgi:hypothetical protein